MPNPLRALRSTQIILTVLLAAGVAWVLLHASPEAAKTASEPVPDSAQIKLHVLEEGVGDKVKRLLIQEPAWFLEDDERARTFILYRCYQISQYSTVAVREGIKAFLQEMQRSGLSMERQREERSKVALLSRVLFHVPSVVDSAEVKSGKYSWVISRSDGKYIACAPLDYDETNQFFIAVSFSSFAYRNEFLNVLEEFDYFESRFGRAEITITPSGRLLKNEPTRHP